MAAVRPSNGRATVTVRLSQVPLDVRLDEAEAFVEAARLGGPEAVDFMTVAFHAAVDVELEVPTWKARRVLAGKRVAGRIPKDLL